MADPESIGSAEMNVVAKSVKELLLDSQDLPEEYICKEGGAGFQDARLPPAEIPVIDLGLLTSPATQHQEEELKKLHSALSTWGCFQAINHGMPSSFMDKIREVLKQFFDLPKEEKQKYARGANDIEGYGSDSILIEDERLDWNDRIYLNVYPEGDRKFKFWPQKPKDFSSILLEYTERVKVLNEGILKAMAWSLKLEDNCFLKQCGEKAKMFVRINNYPPCPRPDLVLGLKPHADGSVITFLLQDKEVEGLQVLKENQWFKVPIISEALLINVGDQIEIMSNGIFKSPVHRVVINSERERVTMAAFCTPESEREIEPVNELVNESRPRSYKSVKNYGEDFFQYFQLGKRPIDAVKI